MKVLVIVPAYNEENNIVTTIDGLKKNKSIDYVVINDGSLDNTKEVCEKNNINFIDLPLNLGIGGAVQTGYNYAFYHDYDIAIQFDGDNQLNPKYIEAWVEEIENGNDLARSNLADILRKGSQGYPKDLNRAFNLYKECGLPYAHYRVGEFYEHGWGVKQDLDAAKAYYQQAYKEGHGLAKKKLKEWNFLE